MSEIIQNKDGRGGSALNASRAILYGTSGFLVVIWLASFAISYVSLVAVAAAGGLTYPWIWLWPLLLDAFMCIGSLDVIRRELNGEKTMMAWAVVIGVTLVSTGFNITRADPSVLSWATHALAPVVCFLAFEIEMGVLRSYFRQREIVPDIEPNIVTGIEPNVVTEPAVRTVAECTGPVTKIQKINVKAPRSGDKSKPVNTVSISPEEPRNIRKEITKYYKKHPDAGYAEAAKELGVSRQVVRRTMLKNTSSEASPISKKSPLKTPPSLVT